MSKPTYEELEKAFREAVRICEIGDYGHDLEYFGTVGAPEHFQGLIERLDASANVKLTKDQALEEYVAALCKAVEGFLDAGFSMEELSEADAMAIAKVGLIYKKRVEGNSQEPDESVAVLCKDIERFFR